MPEVKITHESITGDDAKTAPKRIPIPDGDYHAIIMNSHSGSTRHVPPLLKISVEFQLLYMIGEDNTRDESNVGRRVFQDYILEPEIHKPDMNAIRRYELRMLLDAADIEYTNQGFNSDHLINKSVIITVKNRPGKTLDPATKEYPVYSNVVKVDTATPVDADDIV